MNAAQQALEAFAIDRSPRNRDYVITAHWYLCLRGARKFSRTPGDRGDLLQVAAIGLIKAADGFDPALRTPFEAYAWTYIVGELMHYVRDHERTVRIPRALRALDKQYARTYECLSAQFGRAPTGPEMARALHVDLATIDEVRLLRSGGACVSIEALAPSGSGDLGEPFADLDLDERLTLASALSELAERERVALLGSFAGGYSQSELGRILGLSQSQVSKLIKRALVKMQRRVA